MIFPPHLQKGDSVYLVNIARKGIYDAGVVEKTLNSWGLSVIVGETVTAKGFCQFSDTADNRLADVQKALDDVSVKAIFFLRGGYGTVQILDRIDFSAFVNSPKWLIGYSDITYLHSHINQNFGIATVHATMLSAYATASKIDFESLENILFGKSRLQVFANVESYNFKEVSGELIGGNLSILHTIIGTDSDMSADGKILVIEDVFENLTSVERMLWAMKRSGKFDRLKALLLGDFLIPVKDNETSNCMVAEYPSPTDQTIQLAFRQMILNFFEGYDFPIVFGLAVGHSTGRNIALEFGADVSLKMETTSLHLTYHR
ncbi:S66 peptidase family protein [Flavobacterium silvaticum]|uniref:LD-carboxypeptidase n=1 Tax=Flavobacterium silvaticum TaxID=1852020 RepID=A0A972FLE4_9FLAO|nr:LD-carboxypeptidase [Flavobacterium silvaticum]NMH27385.1 LD-carboxypeptidase [Flavobacterium silvaticum]